MSVSEPGVYRGLDENEYHAHQASLSVSGAKVLLDCPAKFDYQRRHPKPSTAAMNLGSAAHKLVLGVGAEIVEVDADDWRTQAAKEARAEAEADGKLALLTKDHEMVQAMAARLRENKIADLVLGGEGEAEVSLFSAHSSGVLRRGRIDWLPAPADRMIVADYKTAASAEPGAFAKSIMNFRYYMQAAWYSDLIVDLGLASSVAFLFVAQEKDPPYEVMICQLDADALAIGRHQNEMAIELFVECAERNEWPGYGDEVHKLILPFWFTRNFEEVL